jgi:2,4-dienoyl-CoA reductase (NADPH2)
MDSRFQKILEPGDVGRVKTRNRIVKTANGTSFIEESGFVGPRAIAYYDRMAKGGVGLLIVESCGVEYPAGVQHPPVQFHLDDDKYIPSYSELTKATHQYGCPTFIQFQHAGAWNPTGKLPKREPKAASTLTAEELPGPAFFPPTGMTPDEVHKYINIWADAAVRAAKAGFDGVEVNGASCHQINTFFSPIWNKREDEYGCQSLENRSRFMCDIVREIKKRLGKDYPVSCIYNVAEYGNPKGTKIEEGVQFAKYLAEAGADVIHCRGWSYIFRNGLLQTDRVMYPEAPDDLPKDLDWSRGGKGALVPLAAAVKKVVTTVPVFCAGRLDPIIGEEYLRQGKLDFVGMTRRLLADPELPNKVAAGRLEDIVPCTGCGHCLDVRNKNMILQCRVNAALGREFEYAQKPATAKRKMLVVGGGPAGMEAARVAALRGHDVTLQDSQSKLGGAVPLVAMVKDLEVECLDGLLKYYKAQFTKLGVKVNLNKKVDVAAITEFKPDVLILALGGKPAMPAIRGIEKKIVVPGAKLHSQLKGYLKVFSPKTMARLTKIWMPIGKRVVIIGSGIQGCELAEFLIKRGRNVTIVDSAEVAGEGMMKDDMMQFTDWLIKKHVSMLNSIKYEEITDKGLVITTKSGEKKTIEADSIVTAIPFTANTDLVKEMEGKAPAVYAIGDCKEPRLMPQAIADGWMTSQKID